MRPAFASTKSAAVFALLLLVLLALPAVVGKNLLPPREETYAAQGWGSGPYPWIQNQIFAETNDIDIAFLGSSQMFNGINTPYVQAQLTKKFGRPAVVRTIAWGGAGYDALFFIARDLLAQRHVKLLVFYDEMPAGKQRNNQATFWFRWGDGAPALAGLPMTESAIYYFAAAVGMPRNLLCLIRPNLPAPFVTDKPNYWTVVTRSPNPATQLGCLSTRKGFALDPTSTDLPFETFVPETSARATDALIYSPATKTNFLFSTAPVAAWQIHFARQLAALLHTHGVQSVMLYLPRLAEAERRAPVIAERAFWPDILGGATLLGIPPVKLFGGLTDAELRKIYGDPVHLNQNGQEYFTKLITPALIQLYENQTNH